MSPSALPRSHSHARPQARAVARAIPQPVETPCWRTATLGFLASLAALTSLAFALAAL